MITHMISIIIKFIRTKITHQITQNLPEMYLQKSDPKLGNTLTYYVMTTKTNYPHPYITKKIHEHPYDVYNH